MDDQSIITDTGLFRKDLVVSDVVYNPRETKLLKEAAAARLQDHSGNRQAALAGGRCLQTLYRTGDAGAGSNG